MRPPRCRRPPSPRSGKYGTNGMPSRSHRSMTSSARGRRGCSGSAPPRSARPRGRARSLDAHVGDADGADRATIDIGLDRPEALLERRLRVDAVQVVEADRVGAKRSQALLDLRQSTSGRPSPAPIAALGRDEHVPVDARRAPRRSSRSLSPPVYRCAVSMWRTPAATASRMKLTFSVRQAVRAQADAGHVDAGKSESGHEDQGYEAVSA